MDKPLLLLVFNRPEATRLLLQSLRQVKPKKLFVVGDGPRDERPQEQLLCAEVRGLFTKLSWECEIKTLFRNENLGCARSVSSGIDWFFSHVDEGIILEDDCIPHSSFFPYCIELLEKYRDTGKVMHIGSNNFQNGKRRGNASYYFSIYNHLWGWATWKKAWEKFNFNIDPEGSAEMKNFVNDEKVWEYFKKAFENTSNGRVDSWGFRWTYACWANQGLSIVPNLNLVTNIGFGDGATHTKQSESPQSNLPAKAIEIPLQHPRSMEINRKADLYSFRRIFQNTSFRRRVKNLLSRLS
jgi:hypothetical protein